MTTVAVLGAGAGGSAAAVELTAAGRSVRLWARSAQTLQPFQSIGGIRHQGVLGNGVTTVAAMTTDLVEALEGADVALICLPTSAHRDLAGALARAGCMRTPVILNPGHTGGALEFQHTFARAGEAPPPVAELSTLTYVARKLSSDCVTVSGRAGRVHVAAMPGAGEALSLAQRLYPDAAAVRDVIATGLANVNMVLHPPGAVLAAAWVEATGGDFRFYVDAMTAGVVRLMGRLDRERVTVARAFGHELPSLLEEMEAIGTVEAGMAGDGDFLKAIASGRANEKIRAPDSFTHRYYREDFGFGLVPFLALAGIAGVETPVATALLEVASATTGDDYRTWGRTPERMGIAGLDRAGLLRHVRGNR